MSGQAASPALIEAASQSLAGIPVILSQTCQALKSGNGEKIELPVKGFDGF